MAEEITDVMAVATAHLNCRAYPWVWVVLPLHQEGSVVVLRPLFEEHRPKAAKSACVG